MHENRNTTDAPIYFDLVGTLVRRASLGFELMPGVVECLAAASHYRLGVLCNAGARHQSFDIKRVLEAVDILDQFSTDLLVNASLLPTPLPDRRAFAVAAALAEVPVARCLYVSNDPASRICAKAAGMRTEGIVATALADAPWSQAKDVTFLEFRRLTPMVNAATADASPSVLRVGEVDADIGPTFILKGRVVTMNSGSDVFDEGRLVVERGTIRHVLPAGEPVPSRFESAVEVDTGGTIYPGLIDLHNHFAYNVLPLWAVPKRFANRTQWSDEAEYRSNISLPLRALAGSTHTARALVRYVEAKALVGGTTTGQGIRTQHRGGPGVFRGAMRNVEDTDDPRLPDAGTRVPDMPNTPEGIDKFRRSLGKYPALFYHLCEGIDDATRRHFIRLRDNDLIQKSLVGVHSLALLPEDLRALASQGAKIVWSPFSNLLLYGQTLDLNALGESGVTFSIGCDWSPTGSKNLLQELKVAQHVVEKQGAHFTPRDLVRAVTADAARVVGWQQHLGVLRRGAMADMVVITGSADDPYEHLIGATELQVKLVTVHGVARYGDTDMMERLSASSQALESFSVQGATKAFQLYAPDSELNDLKVRDAREILREAMTDFSAFAERKRNEDLRFLSFRLDEPQPFTVLLDNESEPMYGGLHMLDSVFNLSAKAPDWSRMARGVGLDAFEVNTPAYWELIAAQHNIDDDLREMLKGAYGVDS